MVTALKPGVDAINAACTVEASQLLSCERSARLVSSRGGGEDTTCRSDLSVLSACQASWQPQEDRGVCNLIYTTLDSRLGHSVNRNLHVSITLSAHVRHHFPPARVEIIIRKSCPKRTEQPCRRRSLAPRNTDARAVCAL